jgi:hypothetical protein
MPLAARILLGLALCLALGGYEGKPPAAATAAESGKIVQPGRLVVAGRRFARTVHSGTPILQITLTLDDTISSAALRSIRSTPTGRPLNISRRNRTGIALARTGITR